MNKEFRKPNYFPRANPESKYMKQKVEVQVQWCALSINCPVHTTGNRFSINRMYSPGEVSYTLLYSDKKTQYVITFNLGRSVESQ